MTCRGSAAGPAGAPVGGRVFDAVAGEYERHRAVYPEELVDAACQAGGLAPGAPVLEIGCGTGQLTRSLLARGLRVTAVEPGGKLIERARIALDGVGRCEFVNSRLEDAPLPQSHYRAAFSASAIHWVDPEVGWRKLAAALVDGGTLGLLSYFGVRDPESEGDQEALRAALERVAPELAAEWPVYREPSSIRAGAIARRGNVSEVWAWLGDYEIAHPEAACLFEDADLTAVPRAFEHSARELNALLGTMSFCARLSPAQRDALVAENVALENRLGRPIRSSTLACLVTAKRRSSAERAAG